MRMLFTLRTADINYIISAAEKHMETIDVKLTLKISGAKVHDVGYRAFLLEAAEDLRMRGFFVQNGVEEGLQTVNAYVEGANEPVENFKRIVQAQRPDRAAISAITFEEWKGDVEDINVFGPRLEARLLRKAISALKGYEEEQDQMINKKEEVRQVVVGEIPSSTDALVSEIIEPRGCSASVLRYAPADLMPYLNRIGKMEEEISRIKARIDM